MMFNKAKMGVGCFLCLGIFILGRVTVPKPKPEIKIIDNSKSIEQAVEATTKLMLEAQHKQVVLEKHSVRSKSGTLKTDVREVISYSKSTAEQTKTQSLENSDTQHTQAIDVKPVNNFQSSMNREASFMIGRSFSSSSAGSSSDSHYDYLASIGIPLFFGLKANAAYEFNNKTVFIGGSFCF